MIVLTLILSTELEGIPVRVQTGVTLDQIKDGDLRIYLESLRQRLKSDVDKLRKHPENVEVLSNGRIRVKPKTKVA